MKKGQFIFHGWLIVAAGIVAHALGYGSRYSFAMIFPSLLGEFHLGFSSFYASSVLSLFGILFAFGSLAGGLDLRNYG